MARLQPRRTKSELSTEQKVAFVLLLFLGIGGFALGFKSFGANIRRPFDLQLLEYSKKGAFLTPTQQEAREVEAMKTRDTDGDGLSDYDETFVYKTSAYLADSDSDGFDDRMEIFSENDPNCPEGKDCATSGVVENPEAIPDNRPNLGDLEPVNPILPPNFENMNFESTDDIVNYFLTLTPDQIRLILKDSGMPSEAIDSMTDEQVENLLKLSIEQTQGSTSIEELEQEFPSTEPTEEE